MPPSVAANVTDPAVAFSEAEQILNSLSKTVTVTQKAVDALASKGVYSVADAGSTDVSGVAFAVAGGAKEIYAVTMKPHG